MPFGSAVTPAQLRDPRLAAFISHHFRVLVAENAMKPDTLSPAEGRYNFADAEVIMAFAKQHQMPVRGHTLVWHQQLAPWMLREGSGEVSRATLIARLQKFITDVVSHFKGRVYAWDVVNESFQFDEGPDMKTDAQGMRMNDWRRIIGPEYIEIAFRAAAAADPQALLFYNDYETQNPKKVAAMLSMAQDLRRKGVRIDGIGHQMHCSRGWPRVADVARAIDEIAAAGLQQQITELDIALNQGLADTAVTAATPELLQAQADRYRELVSLFVQKRSAVSALLVWGISDAYTWLTEWPSKRFEAPLLFDRELRPKPAYHAVLQAARGS